MQVEVQSLLSGIEVLFMSRKETAITGDSYRGSLSSFVLITTFGHAVSSIYEQKSILKSIKMLYSTSFAVVESNYLHSLKYCTDVQFWGTFYSAISQFYSLVTAQIKNVYTKCKMSYKYGVLLYTNNYFKKNASVIII